MRHTLFLPPFGELSDPAALGDLAAEAEAAGWDGFFLWDHILRPADEPEHDIADVWTALAAVAAATERVRLGPMVTPLTRRRPVVLARQIMSLDRLSRGRLICGLGLGVDTGRELSAFGEVVDPAERGAMLDEGVDLLAALTEGHHVDHQGDHYTAIDVTLDPGRERERPPFWFATRQGARKPVRRASRFEGLFPIESSVDQVGAAVELIGEERGSTDGFDVAVLTTPGLDLDQFERAGATWAMHGFWTGATVEDVRGYGRAGPS